MSDVPQLRLRVSEDLATSRCRVEVLDADGQVLGDLANSVLVGGVKWEMSGGLGPDKSELVRELGSHLWEDLSRGAYTNEAIAERLIDAYEERRGLSGPTRGLGIVTIQLACERARFDTIEVPGMNAPDRSTGDVVRDMNQMP